MGLGPEEKRLYRGPAHRWAVPPPRPVTPYVMFGVVLIVVALELLAVGLELVFRGFVHVGTARALALVGIVALFFANVKSIALALEHRATETLGGLISIVLPRLWTVHFWLNPLAVFSLGLFLLVTPRPQPPFYSIAYGVLLWQTISGIAARDGLPRPLPRERIGRLARPVHHQPAVYVVLLILVLIGFVDSLFP